jgi:hypothetical protein
MAGALHLRVLHHDAQRERVAWPEGQTRVTIGRVEGSHVRLRDERVADLHAVLELTDAGVVVTDLGSAAGTRINGTAQKTARLSPGDVIIVGGCRITLELELEPLPAPPSGLCPRCDQVLGLRQSEPAGYRDATIRFLRCDPCGLSVVEASTLESRFGAAARLFELPALRTRDPALQRCPACLDPLERLTLEWDARWVTVEACPSCGCVVLDDGEGFSLDALLDTLRASLRIA